MTADQLYVLNRLADPNARWLHAKDREAIRAILAERNELLAACDVALAAMDNDGTAYLGHEGHYEAATDRVAATIVKANGGESCGG